MSASSGIGRIEAAFPKHRLLDTLVDHGETISLRQLPRVIRYLDELRAIINAEKEAAQLERSETPEHEPMVFQMDISPPKARGGQQEAAFEHEGTRSSPNTEPEYELVVQDGSGISEQNQGCLQRVIDEVKRARPDLVEMHQCTISLYNAEDLDNAVRLRISDGYIIALTNTAVTEPWPVGVAGTEPVKVYLLPKDHIMRVLDAGVRIVSSEDTALVFPKAE